MGDTCMRERKRQKETKQNKKKSERKQNCSIWQHFKEVVLGRTVAMTISVCVSEEVNLKVFDCHHIRQYTHFFDQRWTSIGSGSHLPLLHFLCWVHNHNASNQFWIWLSFLLDYIVHFCPLAGATAYVARWSMQLFFCITLYCSQIDQINQSSLELHDFQIAIWLFSSVKGEEGKVG